MNGNKTGNSDATSQSISCRINMGFLWLPAVKMFGCCKKSSLLGFTVESAAMDNRVFKSPAA